ncbi:MAG: tetratricopeptide repeat protein [Victivallales bacterium]|jgi:tetratricopeptide (TPR) repeat protein
MKVVEVGKRIKGIAKPSANKRAVKKADKAKLSVKTLVAKKTPAKKNALANVKKKPLKKIAPGISVARKTVKTPAKKVIAKPVPAKKPAPRAVSELPGEIKVGHEEQSYHADDAETVIVSHAMDRTVEKTADETAQKTGEFEVADKTQETDINLNEPMSGRGRLGNVIIRGTDLKPSEPTVRNGKSDNVIFKIVAALVVIAIVSLSIYFLKYNSDKPGRLAEMGGPDKGKKKDLNSALTAMRDNAVREARNGKHNESIAVLDSLLEVGYPKNSILSDKIIILVWAGRHDEAVDLYGEYMETEKKPDFRLLGAIGTAYRMTGQYPEAIKCCDESLALSKGNPDAVKEKVLSLVAAGRGDEAREFIRQEAEKFLDAPQWLNLLVGEAYLAEGKKDEAESFFSAYLKANPENVSAKRMLAEILIQKGQWIDEAEKMIDEVLSAEPANIDGMFLKVTVLLLKKRYAEADELNEKILSLNKNYQPSINARQRIRTGLKAEIPAGETLQGTGDKLSFPLEAGVAGELASAEISIREPENEVAAIGGKMKLVDTGAPGITIDDFLSEITDGSQLSPKSLSER